MKIRLVASSTAVLSALSSIAAPAPSLELNEAIPVQTIDQVTVTGTREKALLAETPASVGAVNLGVVEQVRPMHPGQILGQIPGVAVAVTNGEGHTTAIRQPFTTSPVYLFLEDGIPTRATGFFNHNGLYEVNIPMSGGIEVVRGPGTALYGSDAIGGIVNVLSRTPSSLAPEFSISGEIGSFGVQRALVSAGTPVGGQGAARVDINVTHNDGWRDRTAYDRQSANLRWDHHLNENSTVKVIMGYSKIEQETGANSALTLNDYLNNPTKNNFSIAYRNVEALRISAEYEWQRDTTMVSFIPYFRDNSMELNATFNLSSDPRIDNGANKSYGFLLKVRRNFPAFFRTRVIVGLDYDNSPGSRREDNLLTTRTGSGANTNYTGYTIGTRIYDYDVTFKSISPYVHAEMSPLPKLRVTAGLRYDSFGFDMSNQIKSPTVTATVNGATRYYGQVASASKDYTRLSPKIGATYALTKNAHLYTSYNQGFRGPSEGQIFRAGNDTTVATAITKANLALALRPIKAEQVEFGIRGDLAGFNYDAVAYELVKRDDLVSQRDLATNVSTNVNAGRTRHRGIEVGLGRRINKYLRGDVSFSYAEHTYVRWTTATANFSGKDIESAPKTMGNVRLSWTPLPMLSFQGEWIHLGSYWLEASNSPTFGKYDGHDLFNLRGNYRVNSRFSFFARVNNVTDERFADSSSVSSNTPVFTPGLPRTYYGGVEFRW